MGEKRKRFAQIKQDIKALDRVYQLCNGGVNSTHTEVQEKLGSEWASLVQEVGEAQHEFEKSKRRFHMASELFNDPFFSLRTRDNLADIRDVALAEWKIREKIWADL